ncbi:MAG: phosphoglucosamine mutase [bacterium]|nr:phosphoglucosamine mutase [bacterium]
MEIKPKLQVTGYRGIWGESLNEQIAFEYIRSFAKWIRSLGGRKVLIGRDTRPSGVNIFSIARKAFIIEGIEVTDIGIIPTPSTLLLVKKLKTDGGVMITASHNPIEYNGIKFVVQGGRLTNKDEVAMIEKFRATLSEKERIPSHVEIENEKVDNQEFRKIHINEVIKNIDASLIRKNKFRVVLDPVNGAGSIITQELLKELGCEVNAINEKQTGAFAHPPEPLAQNLGQIENAVSVHKADVGFAQDPDADRLVVIDEKGVVVSEEHTLVLVIKNVLAKTPGDIVINIASSRMSEDIAKGYGKKTFKTKIGEANVVAKMLEVNAPVGGEGGGGAIYPKINTSRDSLVCIGLILELMARENKKISEIVDDLPKYYMKKDKIPAREDANLLYDKLKKQFPDAKIDELDGVRFDWPDSSWLNVRSSITEPIIRIFGEAKTEARVNSLFEQVKLTLNGN